MRCFIHCTLPDLDSPSNAIWSQEKKRIFVILCFSGFVQTERMSEKYVGAALSSTNPYKQLRQKKTFTPAMKYEKKKEIYSVSAFLWACTSKNPENKCCLTQNPISSNTCHLFVFNGEIWHLKGLGITSFNRMTYIQNSDDNQIDQISVMQSFSQVNAEFTPPPQNSLSLLAGAGPLVYYTLLLSLSTTQEHGLHLVLSGVKACTCVI